MGNLAIIDSSFVFVDDNKNEKLLIDFNEAPSNKRSSVKTIPEIITDIMKSNRTMFSSISSEECMRYAVLDTIFVSCLMKSTQPLKIAEIGCADGRLGYNLAEITGSIKAESQLCLIDNIENRNNTCDLLTKASALPVMSMLFSSCENTNLEFDCFDIVVINGSATFDNPYGVVREAVRIARNGGTIICSSAGDYLLESTFKLVFSEREEYSLSPMDIIMTATKASVWL